jgi:hypothetical protein
MTDVSTPKPYNQWRVKPIDRAEDAAYTFGYDLMRYYRAEALKSADPVKVPKSAEERTEVATRTLHRDRALTTWPLKTPYRLPSQECP